MAMEDIMKALMQSAMQSQQGTTAPQQTGGGDMMSQVLGGLMGGGQQGAPQQPGGGDMLSGLLGGLMGGAQQPAPAPSTGGDMMSGLIGSLLGGGQHAGGPGDQMLGALEQIIGGQPGSGQAFGQSMNMGGMGAESPIMGLIQPIVNQLAAKLNISPQIATVVSSIALHYLLSSHPSTSNRAPMDLGSVMQELSSGGLSQETLQKSGMVNDVMQATGLNKQQAVRSLDTTFGILSAPVQGAAG